jgi:2-haloacid dehalogenase
VTTVDPPRQPALAFDVYGTLVDPIRLSRQLARLVGDDAGRIAVRWRQKQLEYTFRLTVMERYEDFAWVTRRALALSLASAGRTLPNAAQDELLAEYDTLEAFADAAPGLEQLAAAGYRLAVLSNGTPAMLEALLGRTGLRRYFDEVISVDEVRAYKPAKRVYEHAARRLGQAPHDVYLVSSNPFDVVGAAAAGLQAAWIDRSLEPFDTIAPRPSVVVATLTELAAALEPPGTRTAGNQAAQRTASPRA